MPEQNAEMERSRKRRIVRRLAIALAIVTIALCVAQWYFTRGVDPRLVGTWTVTASIPGRAGQIYRFGPYGGAEVCNQERTVSCRFVWKARGSTVQFCKFNNQRTFSSSFHRELEFLWCKVTTGKLPDDDVAEHYEIVDIGPDQLSLKWVEGNDQFTLRRLSE